MAYAKTLLSAGALGLAVIAPLDGAAAATITGGQL